MVIVLLRLFPEPSGNRKGSTKWRMEIYGLNDKQQQEFIHACDRLDLFYAAWVEEPAGFSIFGSFIPSKIKYPAYFPISEPMLILNVLSDKFKLKLFDTNTVKQGNGGNLGTACMTWTLQD